MPADVYAMNAEAVSALALCVLPYGPEHIVSLLLNRNSLLSKVYVFSLRMLVIMEQSFSLGLIVTYYLQYVSAYLLTWTLCGWKP